MASFSSNEFARLIDLLTTDEELRSALLNSGRQRTRYQLDLNIRRERFWVVKVEPAFNSRDAKPSMDFSCVLANMDCSLPPLAYRNRDELRKQYELVHAHFTRSYPNWGKSGQNEVENFSNFCKDNYRTGDLSKLGRKCIMLFHTYCCGTPHGRSDIMDFTLKTIPPSLSVDSCEDYHMHSYDNDDVRKERGDVKKKRKEIVSSRKTLADSINGLVRSLDSYRRGSGMNKGAIGSLDKKLRL